MNQYTLLLVDDEEEVIQVIMHKIPWEELGFSVIGHAIHGWNGTVQQYQTEIPDDTRAAFYRIR